MIVSYVASSSRLPPPPAGLLTALAAWHPALEPAGGELLWDTLLLRHDALAVRLQFTLGAALPDAVLAWMPWAGRALSDAERQLVAHPVSTLRVEMDIPADAAPSLDAARFTAAAGAHLARASEGVLVDAAAQRYRAGAELERLGGDAFDARDYVSVHAEARDAGLHLHTHGLARFGKPDLELGDVPPDLLSFATGALNEVAQHLALGHRVRNGDTVLVAGDYRFGVSATARCRDHCGNDVLALVDPPEAPYRDARAPRDTLARFAQDVAEDLDREHDLAQALRWLDHSVALAPRRAEAYRRRARVYERLGRDAECSADQARADALEF